MRSIGIVGILVCQGISVPKHKGLLWSVGDFFRAQILVVDQIADDQGTEPLCTESGCISCTVVVVDAEDPRS
jgi:hypothetical protein